jgi:hypothetical protein
MKITASGKKLVLSREFTATVSALFREFQTRGMPEDENIGRLYMMVAWAAVGGDITERPSESDLVALRTFCDGNLAETDSLIRTCLRRALAL